MRRAALLAGLLLAACDTSTPGDRRCPRADLVDLEAGQAELDRFNSVFPLASCDATVLTAQAVLEGDSVTVTAGRMVVVLEVGADDGIEGATFDDGVRGVRGVRLATQAFDVESGRGTFDFVASSGDLFVSRDSVSGRFHAAR